MTAVRFYKSIRQHHPAPAELIDFFIFHLTTDLQQPFATAKQISTCFEECDLHVPSWLPSHRSKGLMFRPKRYVRSGEGYRLENNYAEKVRKGNGAEEAAVQVTTTLRQLETKMPVGPKRDFLHEANDCFGVSAMRAAVIMCWNLTLHHLQDYVLAHHLPAFNAVLATNQDRTVKTKVIIKRDDFTDVPEGKFLEFCRSSRIITSGIYNKLKGRLDERNTAAHPSGVVVTPTMAQA